MKSPVLRLLAFPFFVAAAICILFLHRPGLAFIFITVAAVLTVVDTFRRGVTQRRD
jgi:hypothetical protein